MTSVKLKFRPFVKNVKEGVLYYQIIHNRVVRQIKTNYKLFAEEWDNHSSEIVVSLVLNERSKYLTALKDIVKWDIRRIKQQINNLSQKYDIYSADDIVTTFENRPRGQTLFYFMENVVIRLKELNKMRTSETYSATLKSFMTFRNGKDVLFDEVDSDLLQNYEAYLKSNDIMMNTISFYMRILRAVYNRAVEKEIVDQRYPFKHVYTGVDKTLKRALPLKTIKQIKELDLSNYPSLDSVRDMFMFSFYTRGMAFVDIAYLKKKNLSNGILSYRRRKTNQQLYIKWESCMQDILDKYDDNCTEYLLPIITNHDQDARKQYQNALGRVNNRLKDIANMIDLVIPLTMYVARHSWASIAKAKNIPISVISEGMGHNSETTTKIYLTSLDTTVVDKANQLIIKLL